ncbi:hypothetical protein Rvan_1641 [Rhodomicrobium vannielii ATCC 17100]|uniref:DNA-binding protein n=1 Tax=Rhodomicrobium vannielii (strain ATCC 17100 / DSM 162 / LMG 4299 / NCIMB 10020 / ATH 3.1.1) TaxID=648757 RepID=E3I8I2_RHOVT|nr:hypothetical protein [Rhodomicrobium vannielii]ADP70891.1 hypothetical protein Rvan_1641 [Rhodomicrobium vannielii ATCC 17100]
MARDLTTSAVHRQNILNNKHAVSEIEPRAGISGIQFEGKTVVTKEQIAEFFDVSTRTIDAYIERYGDELVGNGYEVIRGKRLKMFKNALETNEGSEALFVTLKTASVLGLFDFRAFLNLAMLLTESERARVLRQAILDVAIDSVTSRSGGGTKYINQRDEGYLLAAYAGDSYRKQLTDALKAYVVDRQFKYAYYTDKVYECIFLEKAREYRKVLRLQKEDCTRDTFYSEVLDLIASFEFGFADALHREFEHKGSPLLINEADVVLKQFDAQALWHPLKERARQRMASRDLAFRDALHVQLENYIVPVTPAEFERFLGEKSKDLEKRLEDAKDALKRLKDR